ncbi:MAG: VWA domain-containing protein [Planctomycetes bacterium]|nr:VWA domain-containing protein [Planctomycetota bacterium]
MSLLAPLYILGALAVAGPIVFHMIRRRPRGRRAFSAVMFLSPSPPRTARRSRPDHLLLLALRAAALCLLALAFARPFLRSAEGTAESHSGAVIAVLIDTSASMQRDRLWSDALARAAETVAQTEPADRVGVFTFDATLEPVVSFDEWAALDPPARKELVAERLAARKPGRKGTHLDAALQQAADELEAHASQASLTTGAQRRIVLISDLAEGSRLSGLEAAAWPAGVQVMVERIEATSPTNAGVQLIAHTENGLHAASEVIRARVTNAAGSNREQFEVSWASVGLADGHQRKAADVYCPPGQSRVVRIEPPPASAKGAARLVLTGDDHPFDNTLEIVNTQAEPVAVAFCGSDDPDDPQALRFYLERAFSPHASQPVSFFTAGHQTAPALAPAEVPLAVASELPEHGTADAQRLATYVERGGTLLAVATTVEHCRRFARLTEIDLEADEAEVESYALLGEADYAHGLFRALDDPRFADLTPIHVWRHRNVSLKSTDAAQIVCRFDNGAPAILEVPHGAGRALLMTFGWHPADSRLALSSKFVAMLGGLLDECVGRDDAPQGLHAAADTIPPDESRTDPLPLERLEQLGVTLAASDEPQGELAKEHERQLRAAELEGRQMYWRWLIVAALAVLGGETWLAARLSRRTAT